MKFRAIPLLVSLVLVCSACSRKGSLDVETLQIESGEFIISLISSGECRSLENER